MLPSPERVLVYQNAEEIYWQLEERGLEHEAELVYLGPRQYALKCMR